MNFYYYRYSNVMPLATYLNLQSSMDFLSQAEKIKLYYIYVRYEQWKSENNLYDFMDVVRHVVFQCYAWGFHQIKKLDYLVIDEVQDLTPLTLHLLVNVTRFNVFFCGDTAQTIAKGVGFRFHDLKSIFLEMDIPKVIQLT